MKVDYFNDLEGGINAIFGLKTEDVVRGVVIKYLDYFYSVAANNTSAVIDTKIEQAMDLVKSHLLYTVREEVEVLKLRISELLTRINQLEKENSFLKANATPEVLTALNTRSEEVQTDETSFSTGATPKRDPTVPAVTTE